MKKVLAIVGCVGIAAGISGWTYRFFSPGALALPHAWITDETMDGCAKCHTPYQGLQRKNCLGCHGEIAERVNARKGFHGQSPLAKDRPCETCHHEHRGLAATLVEWPNGIAQFKHDLTGYELKDKHADLACDTCHKDSRIADPAITALRQAHPGRKTYLGLSTDCAYCHMH